MTAHNPGKATGKKAAVGLVISALGVAFGDIGTSPLYAMQTVFNIDHGDVKPSPDHVLGIISLIFWSITGIVSIKYIVFILRADNDGEGGVMALSHLTRQNVKPGGKRFKTVVVLGVIGAALFYGDSIITPAISVLSSVEGLQIAAPSVHKWILPLALTIIVLLFSIQRFGTELIGRAFGPVMVLWFITLAVLGIPHIAAHPDILRGLSPSYALDFIVSDPPVAFVAMGAVVLAITGAESLYADMGHFGRPPISRAWFLLVMPCLVINYLGQAAMILEDPSKIDSPFFHLAPTWATLPLVVLATMATVIASQAVISGAYSMSRQAERLGYLPRLTVRQTSEHEGGQIYVPVINWLLFGGVLILMLVFKSSEKLAAAYGVAVTSMFIITTVMFLVLADTKWKWPRWRIALVALLFAPLEVVFVSANLTKVTHGGWLPLLVATMVAVVMFTWRRGHTIVTERRQKLEGPLLPFLDQLHDDPVMRVPGTAVFMHPSKQTAPLALRENANFNHVVHENVLIVTTVSANVPHVPLEERVTIDDLGDPYDHITHLTVRFGFQDEQDVPAALEEARDMGVEFDADEVYYFLSRISVQMSQDNSLPKWRKRIFVGLAHNAATPVQYFRLPEERTVIMGANVAL
ncbi:potassium transporter Kup [Calidifontibacter indicus]|uniref:potassium transporter Kup n=1 Tax=Calidifontibacter indicus TaxID=419650 RepID=UPI003D72D6E4